jgi:hypothetical protein
MKLLICQYCTVLWFFSSAIFSGQCTAKVFCFFCIFSFISVCFETDLFVSVVSKRVRNTETNRNKPKKIVIGFAKQTENEPKQIEFRFVSVRTPKKFVCFEDTLLLHATLFHENVNFFWDSLFD